MAEKGFHKLNKLLKSTMTFQQQITVNSKNEINSYHHFLS